MFRFAILFVLVGVGCAGPQKVDSWDLHHTYIEIEFVLDESVYEYTAALPYTAVVKLAANGHRRLVAASDGPQFYEKLQDAILCVSAPHGTSRTDYVVDSAVIHKKPSPGQSVIIRIEETLRDSLPELVDIRVEGSYGSDPVLCSSEMEWLDGLDNISDSSEDRKPLAQLPPLPDPH